MPGVELAFALVYPQASGPGYQGGKAGNKVQGLEYHMGGAIAVESLKSWFMLPIFIDLR